MRATILFAFIFLNGLVQESFSQTQLTHIEQTRHLSHESTILNAGFVCVDGVYNSELMAPYDVLQHTIYRDSTNYVRCFIVTPDGKPFVTFEGIGLMPDYSFANVPPIDILIIPSTATSMTADLENAQFMNWLKQAVESASYVITVCDGAFPLAATGE
ncbi:hypothetical protein GWN42_13720, partial [candidate division KSB1 bacterium]|nr:hypothetical protein [candidate division KSB1 bacterium]